MPRPLEISEIPRLLPLNAIVQSVHSAARPLNFRAELDLDPQQVCAFFAEWLTRDTVEILIEEDVTGLALGYVMLEAQEIAQSTFNLPRRRGFVHHVAVLPEARRRGVASGLLAAGREWFLARGMTQWATSYWLFNEPSARLMIKHGLTPAHVVAEAAL